MSVLHARCRCIAAALAEVGLDPDRMMCTSDPEDDSTCCIGFGTGTEGRPLAEVEALCDKAIEICAERFPDGDEEASDGR